MKINISAIKDRLLPSRAKSGNDIPFKDMGILDHIEKIVEISHKHGIDQCLSKGKGHLDYVTGKLRISPPQAVLFSHFMERSDDNNILLSEIADSINCSKIRIIKYINECEELEKKRLIRCSRNRGSISFRVPCGVWNSLRKNNEYILPKNDNLSIEEFFGALEKIFEERSNNELTYENMHLELTDLINLNMHLLFCKKLKSYDFNTDNFVLFVCFCHFFGNKNDECIIDSDLEFLYDDNFDFNRVKKSLSNGSHDLIEAEFIDYANDNGFANNEVWKLSDMAKKELLSEMNTAAKNYKKDLVLFDAIKPKKMFYNLREHENIQTLISLLQEENYRKIQERLDGRGMRKGFACLFSGGPGTGKTETAYQIARETKRNIMMVNIAETKSMWYGQSEKRIKKIFDTYREAADNSEIAPILLFNEADAVIGKRKEIGGSSRAIDQTENTIQNIILQEMENLSGIMIATTNLVQNMDSAFERRFLYKIVFDRPGAENRKGIWNSLMPDLTGNAALELSSRFELSGGQIENIARKIEVDAIIEGGGPSMDTLVQYCKDEIQNGINASKRIGFGV